MGSFFKEIMQWGLALLCSVLLLNCAAFCFYHPVHELKRDGGSTPGLMYPHMWGLYGTEGYGIQTIDNNGYVNPDYPREESYYCITGASHTEGFHTGKGKRYSDLLNAKFGYTDTIKFYNIAHSGFYYEGIVKHFKAMTMEFSEMQGVVIELSRTDYTVESLTDALNQKGFTEDDTIKGLISKLTLKDKCIISLKDRLPFVRLLASQLETYKKSKLPDMEGHVYSELDLKEYRGALSATMDLIRKEYSGPIVIVYHPLTTLDADGSLVISQSPTDFIFEEECMTHDIAFIDMSDVFKTAYYENHQAVYGFWNTTMMKGHINDYGHKLIADVLSDYLQRKG